VELRRHTYACPHCEGQVITADKPAQPIPKGFTDRRTKKVKVRDEPVAQDNQRKHWKTSGEDDLSPECWAAKV
jgi:hypothetical protein